MPNRIPRIDGNRLRALLDGVNGFGFSAETGGYNRTGYSEADMRARDWFFEQMRADGLSVKRDGVNNLFGRYGPVDGPCVMTGSHLDTVPEGGGFDGVLGACVALECTRAMRDADMQLPVAIEVVATAEEEGRFGSMLGSQAIAGLVTREWIDQASDAEGVRLVDAMKAQGLDAFDALRAARDPADIRCFLEMHVEQGPVLEKRGIPIGIADVVSGVCNLEITFMGAANHSGTTPMDMRSDAFAGLVRTASQINAVIAAHGTPDSRITIGKIAVHPNFPHTVPGEAVCVVNIRDTDIAVQRLLADRIAELARSAAAENNLTVGIREMSWLDPVHLDAHLVTVIGAEADALGYEKLVMPSGAGHDAQTMQSLCASGLVFVPSIGGVSHSPQENTRWDDIEKGAQLMLNTLIRLAREA